MLTVRLYDQDGKETAAANLLFVELDMDFFAPAHSVRARFSAQGNSFTKSYVKLAVFYEGEQIFAGFVDQVSCTRTPEGRFIEFAARSLVSVLIDNEALPKVCQDLSLQQLYDEHIGVFGCFAGIHYDRNAALSTFTIPKGTSEWAVLTQFCRLAFGTKPRLLADGSIDVRQAYQGRTYTVSNALPNALRYTTLEMEDNMEEVVTRVWLIDRENRYGVVVNEHLPGFQPPRVRVLREGGDWQSSYRTGPEEMIKAGMLKKKVVRCLLPGIYPMRIGDRVNLNDSMLVKAGLFVGGVNLKVDASGLWTSLTLLEPDYL